MKRLINPAIEAVVNRIFNVDQYADVFEKLAMWPRLSPLAQRCLHHKIAPDVRSQPALFIHIPKNGGTSIKQSLYVSDPGHATIRFYELVAPEMLERAASFAIIRDPVDRFLSGYDFLMNGGGSDVTIQSAAYRRLAHIRSIDDFLTYLESIRGNWFLVDTFARPQWWYVTDNAGNLRVKTLWLLGDQNAAIDAHLLRLGVPGLKHANKTQRISHCLSAVQLRRLEHIYEPDFELHARLTSRNCNSLPLDAAP